MSSSQRLEYARQVPDETRYRAGFVVASVISAGASLLLAFLALGPLRLEAVRYEYILIVYGLAIISAFLGVVIGGIAVLLKRVGAWPVTLFNLLLVLAQLGLAVYFVAAYSQAMRHI